jgi:hypothetical protein
VVDFDGNDQIISTYNFAGNDLQLWRNGGYTAFGVSRYTGGRSNRVISSSGQNWIMGHHGIEMRDFILTVGFIQEVPPIRNFIFGELSRKVVAVMEIHIVPFMQTGSN